jgi:hypothetical protein
VKYAKTYGIEQTDIVYLRGLKVLRLGGHFSRANHNSYVLGTPSGDLLDDPAAIWTVGI